MKKTTEELFRGNEGWEELPRTYEWKNALEFASGKCESSQYFHHIKGVMDILLKEERETDDVILTIAALQNIVSDTDCTNKEIEERFGNEVAEGVDLLTRKDGQSIEDYTRQVFTNEDYLYIREIKLADILYNLRTLSQTASPQKVSQMIDETEQYILPYEKCSPRNLMNRVKEELGDLKKNFTLKKDFKEEPDEIVF